MTIYTNESSVTMKNRAFNASVCLAAYNGERYILQQVCSILRSFGQNDELVIVDDCSTDGTSNIINSIVDDRIRVINLKKNVGCVKAFEIALMAAKNKIVFLSDQDDIWDCKKYSRVMEKFSCKSRVKLVVHGLSTIDHDGNLLIKDWLKLPETPTPKGLLIFSEAIKPRIFGSASAFDRELLNIVLPFPKGVYAHDHWISICGIMAGRVCFLQENLVLRRLHDKNLTPKKGAGYYYKIYNRVIFVYLILLAQIRLKLRRRTCDQANKK